MMEIDDDVGGGGGGLGLFQHRYAVPSLQTVCKNAIRDWIYRSAGIRTGHGLNGGRHMNKRFDSARRAFKERLHPELISELLRATVPTATDWWEFPCAKVGEERRVKCRVHTECEVVYERCDKLISLLFHESAQHISINLSRVSQNIQKGVIEQIAGTVRWSDRVRCPNLVRIDLTCSSVHLDTHLVTSIERLCAAVRRNAPKLRDMRLPVASNECCHQLSYCPALSSLVLERGLELDRKGLRELCHRHSWTRKNLRSLHLGVYRQAKLDKTEVTLFFVQMRNLESFSCFDEERVLFRLEVPRGDKVLTYSVVRLALVDAESGAIPGYNFAKLGPFRTKLREIKVVDRQLKPCYLLETCPRLQSLYLDWQFELSEPPFRRYTADWLSEVVRQREWATLAAKLTRLEVVFPAAHTPNAYSLNLSDFPFFFAPLGGLSRLRLSGAGRGGPLPLLDLLDKCPGLEELTLDNCGLYIPPGVAAAENRLDGQPAFLVRPHRAMRRFSLTRSGESIMFNRAILGKALGRIFPNLRELELQPEAVDWEVGLWPEDISDLSAMPNLRCLSVVVSVNECVMNMPALVVALEELKSLRNLVISWGRVTTAMDSGSGKVGFMTRWLVDVMRAVNADLRVNVSYEHHREMYHNGGY